MNRSTEVRLLDLIIGYIERREQVPSQDRLRKDLGMAAKSRVNTALARLERDGFIRSEKTRTGKRKAGTITLNKMQDARPVPVLGRVAAGQPILGNSDDLIEFVPLPARYARGAELYMLKVQGDSMTGDGILEGDYVIVNRNEIPREDEIAVVLIGEEATIKHLRREGDSIRLVSSNPNSGDQVYRESDNPTIQGKVIGVVRWPH